MTRTDLPAPFIDRLAELVRMTRNGYGGEPWNIPGIKAAISATQDTGAEPLDICCVALTSAADKTMKTPILMAASGKQWTHTTTGKPQPRTCEHGQPFATNQTRHEKRSQRCDQCQKPPGTITAKEAGLKDLLRAELASPEHQARRQQQHTRQHGKPKENQ